MTAAQSSHASAPVQFFLIIIVFSAYYIDRISNLLAPVHGMASLCFFHVLPSHKIALPHLFHFLPAWQCHIFLLSSKLANSGI